MKIHTTIKSVVLAACTAFMATQAMAQVYVSVIPGYQAGSGGEFNVNPVGSVPAETPYEYGLTPRLAAKENV